MPNRYRCTYQLHTPGFLSPAASTGDGLHIELASGTSSLARVKTKFVFALALHYICLYILYFHSKDTGAHYIFLVKCGPLS